MSSHEHMKLSSEGFVLLLEIIFSFIQLKELFLAAQPVHQLLNAAGSTHLQQQELVSESSILAEKVHLLYFLKFVFSTVKH